MSFTHLTHDNLTYTTELGSGLKRTAGGCERVCLNELTRQGRQGLRSSCGSRQI